MIEIPKVAGQVGRLAGESGSRLGGIHVTADGTEARLVATDGHVMGIVRGESIPPGTETCVLVPMKEWLQAFKACGKDQHVTVGPESLIALAAKGKNQPKDAAVSETVVPYMPLEGRFPDYMRVLTAQGLPLFRVFLGARKFIEILQVAAAIAETVDGMTARVELFFYSPTKPIGIVANGLGLIFDGLLMPLSEPKAKE